MKKIAVTLIFIISTVLFGIDAGINASAEETEVLEAQAKEAILQNEIATINTELESKHTDVVSELNDQIAYYENLYLETSNSEEKEKINRLIETTQELIEEYEQYINPMQTRGSFHLIYTSAVATVTAYFNNKGYKLAAELLTHAKDNNDLDSIYEPVNKDIMYQSSVFMGIVNGTSTYGISSFPDQGGTAERDLYNAIHSFYYSTSESGRVVVIQDRYDFAKSGYSSVAGIAVETMYAAQNAGVIVPFISVFTFNYMGRAVQNQTETLNIGSNARYTEELVTLITYTSSSKRSYTIETEGEIDTYLYLIDPRSTYKMKSTTETTDVPCVHNDDGGTNFNAKITKQLAKNIPYLIIYSRYNIGISGMPDIKLRIY